MGRLLFLVFIGFLLLMKVSGKYELQIYSNGEELLLYKEKCRTCTVVPMKFHELYDPSNIRLNIGEPWFKITANICIPLNESKRLVVQETFLRSRSKWCGTEEDEAVESCCSERVNCPVKLKRNQRKGKAVNEFPFSINGCECEEKFAKCLKDVNNDEAKKVLKYHFETFVGGCLIYDHQQIFSEDSGKPKTCIKNKKKPKIWRVRKLKHLRVL
uniref:PLA2-Lol-1 n=1 Tax=Uroteuthis noctiluca TaxID=78427 RepID=R4G2C4_9MOLL